MRIVSLATLSLLVPLVLLSGCASSRAHETPRMEPPPERYRSLEPGARVAIVNATVIDGTGAEPIRDSVVMFSRGRIESVGPAATTPVPPDCAAIDARGAAVMPGIVNAHVHEAYGEDRAAWFAYSGVTTVRDLHCDVPSLRRALEFRDRARDDARLCRIVSAGSLITAPFGHMANIGLVAGSPGEARRKVEMELGLGVDLVKVMFQEPSFPELANLSREAGAAAIAAAHAGGVRASCHVGSSRDLEKALDGGADDICHVPSDAMPDALVARVAESRTPLEGTLTNWAHAKERAVVLANYERLVEAGAVVALGAEHIAEGGVHGPYAGMPIHEFGMMREAGMSPMEIIVASTKVSAAVCGLGSELGTLEPGKAADIIVVDGDPVADIMALGKVRMVIRAGKVIRASE